MKMHTNKKLGKIQAAGIVLCAITVVMRLCSGMIGGDFQDACNAAFPYVMIALAVAIILAAQNGKEERTIEKQDSGIEEEP
jgi:hypothetical protein